MRSLSLVLQSTRSECPTASTTYDYSYQPSWTRIRKCGGTPSSRTDVTPGRTWSAHVTDGTKSQQLPAGRNGSWSRWDDAYVVVARYDDGRIVSSIAIRELWWYARTNGLPRSSTRWLAEHDELADELLARQPGIPSTIAKNPNDRCSDAAVIRWL